MLLKKSHTRTVFVLAFIAWVLLLYYVGSPRKYTAWRAYYTRMQPDSQQARLLAAIDTELVLIKSGTFIMGSNSLPAPCAPEHNVSLGSYFISKYPITIDQFNVFVQATKYVTTAERNGGGFTIDTNGNFVFTKGVSFGCSETGKVRNPQDRQTYPAVFIGWQDANMFCNWLSFISGKKYRLPTEAEWEYAARGGQHGSPYLYSGSNHAAEVAWHGANSEARVRPVGLLQSNALGLHDMSGNVWQWCSDWYAENNYSTGSLVNPAGPLWGTDKVLRGGYFLSGKGNVPLQQLQVAYRGKEVPNVAVGDIGFRIVKLP